MKQDYFSIVKYSYCNEMIYMRLPELYMRLPELYMRFPEQPFQRRRPDGRLFLYITEVFLDEYNIFCVFIFM